MHRATALRSAYMLLYNSLTADKGEFIIPNDRPVTLYVCGVTPYDTTHIGHARTYLVFDVLVRYIRWRGAEVRYCQNVTDVDDPLFERAERDGVFWQDLARQQTERYLADRAALNMVPPTYFPKASEEIGTIIPIVEELIRGEYAYARDGNVYFSIRSDPNFGAMARMGYDEMLSLANQRGNKPNDPLKQDPLDFVLWQKGNPGDPTWESPWGAGRPGWHIECSAMATRYLGKQIDIHGGGQDLLFPHHPCEIAQSEAATQQRPFSRFWVHTGLVWLDGAKMSKSLGNLVFVRNALREHSPDAIRWYLLSFPYNQEFNYERTGVINAETIIARIRDSLLSLSAGADSPLDVTVARDAFTAALDDNLNTPLALDILAQLADTIQEGIGYGRDVRQARTILAELTSVLGLRVAEERPEGYP